MYRVRCPACTATIKIKESLFGQKVSCRCGHVLRLPTPDSDQTEQELIHFSCSSCKKKLAARRDSAGRFVLCPCGTKNQVPSPVSLIPDDEPVAVQAMPAEDPFLDLLNSASSPQQSATPHPLAAAGGENPYAAPVKNQYNTRKRKKYETGNQTSSESLAVRNC